jgi:ABC-type glycerol-3-phosphate transport system substrate-binding protein
MTLTSIGHSDFYNTLDTTWSLAPEDMPDLLLMHNEKTAEYANKEMLYPLDKVMEQFNYSMDLDQIYENIDRGQFFKGKRFGVPVDAHGFLTHFRQDIIKKNGLGFDGNTRFVPQTRAEYQSLLEALKTKANSTEGLLVRNILKGNDHSWKKVNPGSFFPEFNQTTDPDGLGSIYANGDKLATEDGKTIKFHESKGFQTYLTDIVDRWNDRLMGEPGTNVEGFSAGNCVIFSEGPWWTSLNYDPNMNLKELRTAEGGTWDSVGKNLGVSEEDANDPIISQPMTAMNSAGFWTLEENMGLETANSWYGNGHAFSITRRCESALTALAALEFAKWYTQGKDDAGHYHLAKWATGGHVPAWKNVFNDEHYQSVHNADLTLRALGNPAKIIAMEPLQYETTIFNAVATSVNNVIMGCKGGTVATHEDALAILNETAESAQFALDMLFEEW